MIIFILLFIIIVAIYAALSFDLSEVIMFIGILGAVFMILYINLGASIGEKFAPNNAATEGDDVRLDTDDNSMSIYGNMSLANDMDSTQQRIPNIDLTRGEIDNSDLVEQVVQRGNTVFQPANLGVTAASSAQLTNFTLAGPSGIPIYDHMPTYSIAQNNHNSIDELLARKQQHRGSMNQRAIDGRVRSTKNLYKRYFQNELDENEKRVWYSAEAHEMETDFEPW